MGIARNIARLIPNGSGELPSANLATSSVTEAKIASNAITDSKILSGTISAPKLATGVRKVIAVKSSVTGQSESRAGYQNGAFLNSTSSYVSGLTAITHAASSTDNYLVFRFHANFRGQANTDAIQTVLFRNGSVLQGGGIMHGSQSTGNSVREMSISNSAILKPTDTNSHSYMIGWACTEGGVPNCWINQTEDPNYSSQCTFEMWEVVLDQANASGNLYASYYFS